MWLIFRKCLHSGLKFRRHSRVMLRIATEVVVQADGRLIFNETRNHWNHWLRRGTSRMVTSGGTVASLVTIIWIWKMFDKLLIMKIVYFLRRKNQTVLWPYKIFTSQQSDERQWVYPITGVNFTNVLQAAFTNPDPKSAKKTVKLSTFMQSWDLRV